MASFETGGIRNLDPADFGEPTPETRERFNNVLDRLKQLAVSKTTIEVDDIIGDVDIESRHYLSRDELCPITQYYYDQMSDPLFGPDEDVYFMFQLSDGDPEKFDNWQDILSHSPLNSIHYEGADVDIYYDASFDVEMLYITEPRDASTTIFSDDSASVMLERVKDGIQAVEVGATEPTEGSMRRLIEVLEQEIAKRIVSD